MLINASKCSIDHGPQRMNEELLQTVGQNTRRSDRRSQGHRSVRLHCAMPRVAFP
jgi:hypothetical protein